ncbi:unnamed protein product [Rotaria socialis]|uniref:Uncharacterized protein n=1 Tax=Rotaria socialis TaxID=392032 RepID=A0A821GUX7_9BILA|nr:unnamed protein product [Rotaria socialis]
MNIRYEFLIRARPDSGRAAVNQKLEPLNNLTMVIPDQHHFGDYNDRFAIGSISMMEKYTSRWHNFSACYIKNIHAEPFLSSSPIILFITVNQSSPNSSPLNLIINFTESLDFSLQVNEIHLGLLVIQSNFIINNQSELVYSSHDIPILNWKNSNSNEYDLVGIVHLDNNENENNLNMCQWTFDRWNQIFNGNSSNKSSFVHILTTENTNLMFTLMNPTNLLPPAPYLSILHCFPYRLETTELILVLCSMFIFVVFLSMSIFLHCRKEEYQFFSKLAMKKN